jgi:transcriptional regulator with XRE-family HTH domain
MPTDPPFDHKIDTNHAYFYRYLGTILRNARTEAGLSIRELARRAGLDPTYLSRIERSISANVGPSKIAAIAAQLPLSELARYVEQWGYRNSMYFTLQLVEDLEESIAKLPPVTFENDQWVAIMTARLGNCLALMRAGSPEALRSRKSKRFASAHPVRRRATVKCSVEEVNK